MRAANKCKQSMLEQVKEQSSSINKNAGVAKNQQNHMAIQQELITYIDITKFKTVCLRAIEHCDNQTIEQCNSKYLIMIVLHCRYHPV